MIAHLYADLAVLASANGSHHLAADMYMLAAQRAAESSATGDVSRAVVDGYVTKANAERAKAQGIKSAGGAA